MKGRILSILQQKKGVVSGEKLSSQLGISRVSIWKHMNKLQEFGYDIITTSKGYQLAGSPDVLFPWEFPQREPKIQYFPKVTSTMDIAGNLARKGSPDFTVVIAECQTKGRGRLKRTWYSSQGGLYFTIILRPPISPVLSPRINFAASLALVRVLRKLYGVDAMVKWPNDILCDGKKVSGMLSEMEAEGDMVTFINVGMGINVNNDPEKKEPGATSLKKMIGRQLTRKKLLSEFLDEFEKTVQLNTLEKTISRWKKCNTTIGRRVKIVTNREVSAGLAIDVDDNGALVLELENGSIKKIIYGDCFHQI
ncbi:MAG: biotin--[acetyl-CoA-carboxylase] ligase [Thermodesulfobacteriota bacterium]|nr:biotin--[acetyl-CoA-carboxylase] ligase [Thermodesulfobacteriota bacterium]